jgi:hypothetical protein
VDNYSRKEEESGKKVKKRTTQINLRTLKY